MFTLFLIFPFFPSTLILCRHWKGGKRKIDNKAWVPHTSEESKMFFAGKFLNKGL